MNQNTKKQHPLCLLSCKGSGEDYKPPKLVQDIVNEGQVPQLAIARIIDEYIRVVVQEMVKYESLTVAGGGESDLDDTEPVTS